MQILDAPIETPKRQGPLKAMLKSPGGGPVSPGPASPAAGSAAQSNDVPLMADLSETSVDGDLPDSSSSQCENSYDKVMICQKYLAQNSEHIVVRNPFICWNISLSTI